jgi:hypothetical protein
MDITADMAGCWLDGAHGWHNAYRVVDRAEGYGFTVPREYEDSLSLYRQDGPAAREEVQEAMNGHGGLSDQATEYLNERAPEGYVFVWDAGELSLMTEADAEFI